MSSDCDILKNEAELTTMYILKKYIDEQKLEGKTFNSEEVKKLKDDFKEQVTIHLMSEYFKEKRMEELEDKIESIKFLMSEFNIDPSDDEQLVNKMEMHQEELDMLKRGEDPEDYYESTEEDVDNKYEVLQDGEKK